MKAFTRIVIAIVATSILFMAAGVSWLFLYSGDLPGLEAISNFAPTTAGVAKDQCIAPQALSVIPYTALGTNVRKATRADERNIEYKLHVVFSANITARTSHEYYWNTKPQ